MKKKRNSAVTSVFAKSDVARIQEKFRLRRIKILFIVLLPFALYFIKRAFEMRELRPGLPSLPFKLEDIPPESFMHIGFLFVFFMLIILVVLILYLNARKSPHVVLYPGESDVTKEDVRGLNNIVKQAMNSLFVLAGYKRFGKNLGGRPRRGLLFAGPPGTGKTLLAKAMANEAGVPFLQLNSTELKSMWHGMSSQKVRQYFRKIKKLSRKYGGAIGFIDEIDEVTQNRGGVAEQYVEKGIFKKIAHYIMYALNSMDIDPAMGFTTGSEITSELLVQMQGMEKPLKVRRFFVNILNKLLPPSAQLKAVKIPSYNYMVIGATNRVDTLDPALMRPGRLDKIIHFHKPSKEDREDHIKYRLEQFKVAESLKAPEFVDKLAQLTKGYSGADIEHLFNEAAILVATELYEIDKQGESAESRVITFQDIREARNLRELGEKTPTQYILEEKNIIATHEAGHALVAYYCMPENDVETLSIVKRGLALGLVAHEPKEERFTRSKDELYRQLQVALSGYAAEEIYFGKPNITTGPASDLQNATNIAASMVGVYGMGKSLISFAAAQTPHMNIIPRILADDKARVEVDKILTRAKTQAKLIIKNNKEKFEKLRDAVLEKEELYYEEIKEILDN